MPLDAATQSKNRDRFLFDLAPGWALGYDNNQWIVGTPDDCIAGIERLQELSGGFGNFMVRVEDWAPRDKIHRSYELLARYVMPRFQGSLEGIFTSQQWASERREALQANRTAGLKQASDSFYTNRN